ncbi:MAG: sugar phosphate nucleotidyltransferase [Patescibacteria group bacterium]
MKLTKAIIPVAGYGTRRLPVTKVIEKYMMPLLNRPIVDYTVQECIKAGVTDIYFVTGKDSVQLQAYYSHNVELEDYLKKRDQPDMLEAIQPPQGINFHYIEQDQTNGHYGTTVPVWLCRDVIKDDEPVLIIMGDQCLYREDGRSDVVDMIADTESQNVSAGMIAVPVPDDQVSYYGIIAMDENQHFSHIVDRPSLEEAPSNLNNASIYLMPGAFWEFVQKDMDRPHDGEYKLTDAINEFVANGHNIAVHSAKGTYLDCGNLEGWVEANQYLIQRLKP